MVPMKRYGKPQEVANVARFMALEDYYSTGNVINVDGGIAIGA